MEVRVPWALENLLGGSDRLPRPRSLPLASSGHIAHVGLYPRSQQVSLTPVAKSPMTQRTQRSQGREGPMATALSFQRVGLLTSPQLQLLSRLSNCVPEPSECSRPWAWKLGLLHAGSGVRKGGRKLGSRRPLELQGLPAWPSLPSEVQPPCWTGRWSSVWPYEVRARPGPWSPPVTHFHEQPVRFLLSLEGLKG